ncbi:MAG: hypothetical protein LBG80_05930, partial [Bacteroidales bacterium]|nr:hypothetical protein [Bacteroidales bacterium]
METTGIIFFRPTILQNGEYVSFMSETERQAVTNGVDTLGLGGLYPFFKNGLTLVQQTHGVSRGNP